MKIEKEYNVQGLADKVKGCIKTVCETKSRNVSLDVITAQEIVDVLVRILMEMKNAIYAYMKKIA